MGDALVQLRTPGVVRDMGTGGEMVFTNLNINTELQASEPATVECRGILKLEGTCHLALGDRGFVGSEP